MGLWLYEDVPSDQPQVGRSMTFSLADEATQIRAALIRAGAWDDDGDPCCAEVVDLAAVRAMRECR
jgi:hypothetical protein